MTGYRIRGNQDRKWGERNADIFFLGVSGMRAADSAGDGNHTALTQSDRSEVEICILDRAGSAYAASF